jgi:hypothetical protein
MFSSANVVVAKSKVKRQIVLSDSSSDESASDSTHVNVTQRFSMENPLKIRFSIEKRWIFRVLSKRFPFLHFEIAFHHFSDGFIFCIMKYLRL